MSKTKKIVPSMSLKDDMEIDEPRSDEAVAGSQTEENNKDESNGTTAAGAASEGEGEDKKTTKKKKAAGGKAKKASRVNRRKAMQLDQTTFIGQIAGRVRIGHTKENPEGDRPKWKAETLQAVNDALAIVTENLNNHVVQIMRTGGLKTVGEVQMAAAGRLLLCLASSEKNGLRHEALKAGSTALNTFMKSAEIRKGGAKDAAAAEADEEEVDAAGEDEDAASKAQDQPDIADEDEEDEKPAATEETPDEAEKSDKEEEEDAADEGKKEESGAESDA